MQSVMPKGVSSFLQVDGVFFNKALYWFSLARDQEMQNSFSTRINRCWIIWVFAVFERKPTEQ